MPDRHVRNISRQIFNACAENVTTNFELNKELLNDISDIESKSMRNKIAGRLVVLKKNEKRIILAPKKTEDSSRRRRSKKKK